MNITTIILLASIVPVFFMFDVGEAPDSNKSLEMESNLDPMLAAFGLPPTITGDFSVNGTNERGQFNVKNPLGSAAYFRFSSDMIYTPYIYFDKESQMVKIEQGDSKTIYFDTMISGTDTVQRYRRDIEIVIFVKEESGDFKTLRTFTVPAYINVKE